ncbi:hypothetical protein Tco_0839300 [Tanacetum coccineum]|uniref:Uncharacterized protein n=1 Tax=Tanacetum coccineum TaxID=301880 RepID=A0ABQ5AR50_9ASTR
MDNPKITMEEYISLKEEKARRRRKVFNWETATYGKIWDNEDIHNLVSVETEFPAISFNDEGIIRKHYSCEPTPIDYNDAQMSKSDLLTELIFINKFDLNEETSLSECDEEEQNILNFNNLFPFNGYLSLKQLPGVINIDVGAYAQMSNKLLKTRPREGNIDEYVYKFSNQKILKCWSLETSRRLFNTNYCLQTQLGESTEKISGKFLILILFNSRI